MINSDLSHATFGLAQLQGTAPRFAYLTDPDLTGARNLTQAQLNEACGKPRALPPGLVLDKPCPVAPPLNQKTTP